MNETIKDLADFAKMTSPVLRESGDSTLKAIADALDLSQVEIKRLSAINAELKLALTQLISRTKHLKPCEGTLQLAEQALEKSKQ